MSKRVVHIYVEGKGDLIFISHFISKRFNIEFFHKKEGLEANSKTGVPINLKLLVVEPKNGGGIDNRKIKELMNEISSTIEKLGIESILLLDADTDKHKKPPGGFKARTEFLETYKKEVNFDYFLIPNHSENGNLEDLLKAIISENGKPFFECLKKYMLCLQQLPKDKTPRGIMDISDFSKEQMAWYTYMMQGSKNRNTGVERDYSLEEIWDLESESLSPIYTFLKNVLKLE